MDFKKLLPIIGIVILVYYIATLNIDDIIMVFSELNPLYAILSFLIVIPILLSVSIEWMIVLKKHKISVPWPYTIKNILIGYFYGFITPGGLGAYTRALYLADESGEPLPKCLANVLVFNTMEFITLLILGATGALMLSSVFPAIAVVIIGTLIVIVVLFWFLLKKDTSKGFFKKILEMRILQSVKDRLDAPVDDFFTDLPRFRDLWLPFGVSFIGWIVRFSEFYVVALLFNIKNIPYLEFILICAMASIIANMPITICGLGVREVILAGIFSVVYGTLQERVISMSLFWFVVALLLPSIIGAPVTLFETKKLGKKPLDAG